jgi:hypothetical protein
MTARAGSDPSSPVQLSRSSGRSTLCAKTFGATSWLTCWGGPP